MMRWIWNKWIENLRLRKRKQKRDTITLMMSKPSGRWSRMQLFLMDGNQILNSWRIEVQ